MVLIQPQGLENKREKHTGQSRGRKIIKILRSAVDAAVLCRLAAYICALDCDGLASLLENYSLSVSKPCCSCL